MTSSERPPQQFPYIQSVVVPLHQVVRSLLYTNTTLFNFTPLSDSTQQLGVVGTAAVRGPKRRLEVAGAVRVRRRSAFGVVCALGDALREPAHLHRQEVPVRAVSRSLDQ